MAAWDGLTPLGHENPTPEVCALVLECAARLKARDIVIFGEGGAVRRAVGTELAKRDAWLALSEEVSPASMVVAVWTGAKMLAALENKPCGVLALGPRPGTVRGHGTEHTAALYETAEKAGYVSVQRWGVRSQCFLDIADGELSAEAAGLVGGDAWFSAQELFAPVGNEIAARDEGVWHRWYGVKDELEMLSWADRIQRDGMKAVVPDGFERLTGVLRALVEKRCSKLGAIRNVLARRPEVARGFAVWRGMVATGYHGLDAGLRGVLDGLCHANAGHPSARCVAAAHLDMYYDNVAYTWPRLCSMCYAHRANLGTCPCGKVAYCDALCQRAHWSLHKATCARK